jgi:hypothetical protein
MGDLDNGGRPKIIAAMACSSLVYAKYGRRTILLDVLPWVCARRAYIPDFAVSNPL